MANVLQTCVGVCAYLSGPIEPQVVKEVCKLRYEGLIRYSINSKCCPFINLHQELQNATACCHCDYVGLHG